MIIALQDILKTDTNELRDAMLVADLVIVETTINDIDSSYGHHNDIQQSVELLIHLLWSLPRHPSIIWLTPSTQLNVIYGDPTQLTARTTDATFTHLPTIRYYDIPFISVPDALGPFTSFRYDLPQFEVILAVHWQQESYSQL
jgi:hypothetical protein